MADEQELIAALRQRDPDALSEVFTRYADRIYRLALSVLHDEQQADGVVQDSFLALIEHIDTFEGRASIGTWLYRVAYNGAMGCLRRQRPAAVLDEMDEEGIAPAGLLDWRNLPEDVLTGREAAEQVAQAVAALAPTLRAVFTLRDVEQLSTRETAAVLGISEAAVKVRLHRARLALREQLAGYFEEYMAR